jgi:hypothetical protein
MSSMAPQFSNPMQWQQNVGLARAACARIFRDGGAPADALQAFHLDAADAPQDWAVAVDRIAAALSQPQAARKAA